MHPSRIGASEIIAAAGGALLAVSLLVLPWYETNPDNPNAKIDGVRGSLTGWEVHTISRYLMLAAAVAPISCSTSCCATTSSPGRAAS